MPSPPPPPDPRPHYQPLDSIRLDSAGAILKELLNETDLQLEIDSIRRPGVNETVNFFVHSTSLFTAHAVSRTITAPMERVKLIMQTQAISNVAGRRKFIQGLYHGAFRLPATQGYRSLWRGNGANVLRSLPSCMVVFSSNDVHKEMLCGAGMAERKSSLGKRVTFAGFFGLCATIVSYPLDVCRTRMSVDMTTIKDIKGEQGGGTGRTYTSITQCVKEITKREGWRALYRGVSLSLLSSVPYATISFTAYDNLRGRYERDHRLSEGDTTTEESFLSRVLGRRRMQSIQAGTLAFTFASALVYPVDTLRRRLIVDGSPSHKQQFYFHSAKPSPSSLTSSSSSSTSAGGGGTTTGGTTGGATTTKGVAERSFSTVKKLLPRRSVSGNANGSINGSTTTVKETISEMYSQRGPPFVQAALRIWTEEGVIGFYRGVFASIVRSVPRAAMMFLTYDIVKSSFAKDGSGPSTQLRRTMTRFSSKKEQ